MVMQTNINLLKLLDGGNSQAVQMAEFLQLFEQVAIANETQNLMPNGHNIDRALNELGCTPLGQLVSKLPELGLPSVHAQEITVSGVHGVGGGGTIKLQSPLWTLEVISTDDEFTLSVTSSSVSGLLASLR
jgi:hypothetical protein